MLASFRTGLDEVDALFGAPLIHICQIYSDIEVFFASEQHEAGVGDSLRCHVVPHRFDALPTLGVRHIEHQNHPVARFEISGYYRPELLLTSCIPNAQLHLFFLNLDVFVAKVNRSYKSICEIFVADVSPKYGGLSSTRVANQNNFIPHFSTTIFLDRHYRNQYIYPLQTEAILTKD